MIATYRFMGPAKKNPHKVYMPTDNDMLWLGRAFVGEHGKRNPDQVKTFVWCMLNRFFLYPGNKHWPSFLFMLRRFSQPVNPRWQRGGDLALRHPNSPMCTEAHFKRRARICAMKWSDIPKPVRGELHKFENGTLGRPELAEVPERLSNFAAATADLQRRFPEGYNVGGNWYFEDRNLRKGSVVIDLWS